VADKPKPEIGGALARKSVGTLIHQQRNASRDLRDTFGEQVDKVAAKADSRRKEQRDAVVLALLLASSKRMAPDLSETIYDSRQAARAAARSRLSVELRTLGISLAGYQWVVSNRRDEDRGYADHVADSLLAQWRGLAMGAVLGAARKERTAAQAIRSADSIMRPRLDRAAQSEVARAYSDEHAEAVRDVIEHDRTFRDGELADAIEQSVMRQWSAMADACARCWPLDGVTVGVNESFPGGEEPGYVHPHCQCIEILVRA
jgi:hypothetical protein